jgi:hypothetical protein
MKRVAPALILLLLLTPHLLAAEDLTGTWGGTLLMAMDGKEKNGPMLMVLKQTGGTFTGTAGPDEKRQNAATVKGTVETVKRDGKAVTNVTLDLTPEGDDLAIRFALTLVDGRLQGKGQHEFEGRKMTGVLDVARLK